MTDSSSEKSLQALNDSIKNSLQALKDSLDESNEKILRLEGRLSLRGVIEDFEETSESSYGRVSVSAEQNLSRRESIPESFCE
jgi:hypothetical protein